MLKSSIYIFSLISIITSCSSNENKTAIINRESSSEISSVSWFKSARKSVYEVVVQKIEDSGLKFERALPLEKLSFKERSDKYVSVGTAFSVGKGRYISAAHVFNPHLRTEHKNVYLRDIDGDVYKIENILRFSLTHDLIEFDLESPSKYPQSLAVSDAMEIGDEVFTVGNAQGEGISIRGGQLSSFTPEQENGEWNYIRYSAAASPGNSGGPLLNKDGKVIGVVTMKNSNENLNYAVPFSQVNKLPEAQGTLKKRNVAITMFGKSTIGDIDLTLHLPSKYNAFKDLAVSKTNGFFMDLFTKYKTSYRDFVFPASSKSQHYLRYQTYSTQLLELDVDSAGSWVHKKVDYKNIDLGNDRQLVFGQSGSGETIQYNFSIPKPKEMGLQDFVSNPIAIMDELLRALNFHKQVADEKIRITSFGAPNEIERIRDNLNRPWTLATWRFKSTSRTMSIFCTPVPKGVTCAMLEIPTSYETFGVKDINGTLLHLQSLSYFGTLKEWEYYLKLDKSFLPLALKDSKIEFKEDKSLTYAFGNIKGKFSPNHSLEESSLLMVSMGYSLDLPLKHEVHGVRFQPRVSKKNSYQATSSFAPLDDMSSERKEKWKDMINKNQPYNGKAFVNKESRVLIQAMNATGRDLASENSPSDRIYFGSCTAELNQEESELEKACLEFIRNLKFLKKE